MQFRVTVNCLIWTWPPEAIVNDITMDFRVSSRSTERESVCVIVAQFQFDFRWFHRDCVVLIQFDRQSIGFRSKHAFPLHFSKQSYHLPVLFLIWNISVPLKLSMVGRQTNATHSGVNVNWFSSGQSTGRENDSVQPSRLLWNSDDRLYVFVWMKIALFSAILGQWE